MHHVPRYAARLTGLLLTAGLAVTGLVAPAVADSAPQVPGVPTTVSADSLPTVQVDGVVWDQAIVGDTVYASRAASPRPDQRGQPPG
jgi:trimeric autotransporter adhesin